MILPCAERFAQSVNVCVEDSGGIGLISPLRPEEIASIVAAAISLE
jgi:hypothetical protein